MHNKASQLKTNNNILSNPFPKPTSPSLKSAYQYIKNSTYFIRRRKRYDKSKYNLSNSEFNYSNSLFNESNASFHLKALTTMKSDKIFSFSSTSSSSSTHPNITRLNNTNNNKTATSPSNVHNSVSNGNDLPFIKRILQNEQEKCDNDYETEEYFLKLKLEEFNTALYTLISITCGMLYHNSITNDNNNNNKPFTHLTQTITLILITLSVVLFNLSSLNRYLIILHIDKYTLQVLKTKSFCSVKYCGYFISELCISLMHPNIYCRNIHIFVEWKS